MNNFDTIKEHTYITIYVDKAQENNRLDRFLTDHFPRYSRNFFKKIIEDGNIAINGAPAIKASHALRAWDEIALSFRGLAVPGNKPAIPDDMGVRILYTHPEFMIIYKPAGLLVHAPHAHSTSLTLCDWLTHQYDELTTVGFADRPGIVHRLDKDTSGLMIIPRTCHAHATFSDLFRLRKIEKTYLAVVHGHPEKAGTVDFNIMRHPIAKTKMTHSTTTGRQSLTHYAVQNYFKNTSLLSVKPVTGRTHQIRVHCASIGHPIVGDPVYGNGEKKTQISRQALHAYKLSFSFENKMYTFIYDIPQDIKTLIAHLA